MGTESAPLWLLLVTQVVSILGDSIGQRVGRVGYKFSRRHLMLGMTVMNAIQMGVLLCLAQVFLPPSITGTIYIDSEPVSCYREWDLEYQNFDIDCNEPSANCHTIDCPSQGPFTFPFQLFHFPGLLLVGIVNWGYYVGEILLYKEPLGLLFLVLSSLFSSFLISPMTYIAGMPSTSSISVFVYIFGIIGALLCTIEIGSSYGWLFWRPFVVKYSGLLRRTFLVCLQCSLPFFSGAKSNIQLSRMKEAGT